MPIVHISPTALRHNLEILAHQAGSIDKLAVVLKDNAYGHDTALMSRLCYEAGVRHAVVRDSREASQIAQPYESILLLAQTAPLATLPSHWHIAINSLEALEQFPAGTRIELKIDTGMHRNGIAMQEVERALERVVAHSLVLAGVFTHHRSADGLNSDYFWQEKRFDAVVARVKAFIEAHTLPMPRFHSANSAAAFRTQNHRDMVRVGIALYGLLQMPEVFGVPALRPVLSLWADKIATRDLQAGERIGYDGTAVCGAPMTVSTYDAGYADGLLRLRDGHTHRLSGGERLLGRVSMDNISVESQTSPLCIYDDARTWAASAGTIAYEVVVRIPAHVERRVVD
ncbi:MAG: hypothetical protein KU37_02545 [Sulfuricurvum sp. PC08-66]|nr:MAG: hypothetical protein KU37_02545 [Sulfuricurvum sp. PC08-66]